MSAIVPLAVKRYTIETDAFDPVTIVVDVDMVALTPEVAHEINRFWSDADARLAAANEDPVRAVIKFAASYFIQFTLEGNNPHGCNSEMDSAEGWPSPCPIRLVSIDGLPEYDSVDYIVREGG